MWLNGRKNKVWIDNILLKRAGRNYYVMPNTAKKDHDQQNVVFSKWPFWRESIFLWSASSALGYLYQKVRIDQKSRRQQVKSFLLWWFPFLNYLGIRVWEALTIIWATPVCDMAACNAAGRFQEGYAIELLYPCILPNRMVAVAFCVMNVDVNQDDGGIRDGKSGAVQKLLRLKMIN